jgi:hypothetical protein
MKSSKEVSLANEDELSGSQDVVRSRKLENSSFEKSQKKASEDEDGHKSGKKEKKLKKSKIESKLILLPA